MRRQVRRAFIASDGKPLRIGDLLRHCSRPGRRRADLRIPRRRWDVGRGFPGRDGCAAVGDDDIDLEPGKLSCDFGEAFVAALGPAILDRDGAAIDPASSSAAVQTQQSNRPAPSPSSRLGTIVGSFPVCCARAASGHAIAPPSSVMNSRRGGMWTGHPSGWPRHQVRLKYQVTQKTGSPKNSEDTLGNLRVRSSSAVR